IPDLFIIGMPADLRQALDVLPLLCQLLEQDLAPVLVLLGHADLLAERLADCSDRCKELAKPVRRQRQLDGLQAVKVSPATLPVALPADKPPRLQGATRGLVVDDHPGNLMLVSVLMEDMGVEVTGCHTGVG